ncbi:hypothetical protein GYMLUDRAFT_248206 [Collybiopsis luxurians FD-317 M1]|uniref:Unplaced genomic scaffold GYMLUscaffold_53, whole genome shotgun sequence n=1 Tax=Collybiopsis luxurians FD-317 M1 TaxID=944289 RepID=A0A0D0CLH8_9AGAR|nr:hypothetical protein GYMLUDRAFT_248206 [Collybiopsis luxurians FD-317 M1]
MATEVKLAIREFGLSESVNVSVVIGNSSTENVDTGSDNGNDDVNVTIDQGNFPDTSTTSSSSTGSATSARATSPLPASSNGTPSSNVVAPTSTSSKSVTRSQSLSNSPPAVSGFSEIISKSSGTISTQSSPAQISRSQSLSAQPPISQSFNSQSSLPPESSSSLPTQLSSGVASPKSHKAVSTAVIIGSIVGSIVALLIVSFFVFCFLRRRRARNQLSPSQLITTFATAEAPINLTTGSHITLEKASRSTGLAPDYNLAEFKSRPLPAYSAEMMAQTSHPPAPTGSMLGSEGANTEPVATHLESMQNLITQIMGHVQRLETEREHDGDSVTLGSILPPPPTYASE